MPANIPAYIFNEHNEAYYFWHKARLDGYLNTPLDIYHVDAHSDMANLQKLRCSLYCDKKNPAETLAHYRHIAYQEMNIANFLIPAVLNNIVKSIYFVFPAWRQYKRRIKKANVATAFGDGHVFKHDIKMKASEKAKIMFAYPDLKEYRYIRTDIERVPSNRKVILDIDLDYFACTDSITNRMSYELAITRDQYLNRDQFVRDNASLQYSDLRIDFRKRKTKYTATIRFEKEENQDHLPSKSEIKREVNRLVDILAGKNVKPVIITICRSNISGYCPPQYFQMIEDYLLQQLHARFPRISIST